MKNFRILLRKFAAVEYIEFVDYISPRKAGELWFDTAVKLQSEISNQRTLPFHRRWKCLNLVKKRDVEDYTTFA